MDDIIGQLQIVLPVLGVNAVLQQCLVVDGSNVVDGPVGRATRDIVFTSPSTAGAIVEGRSCNGRIAWVSPEGSFGQWESRGLA